MDKFTERIGKVLNESTATHSNLRGLYKRGFSQLYIYEMWMKKKIYMRRHAK